MAADSYTSLLTFLLSACCWRLISSQLEFLGPDLCLSSRTELIPCTFRANPIPIEENQVGTFRTRFLPGTNPPVCRIIRDTNAVRSASVIGTTNPVYSINSPGIELIPPSSYGDDAYVQFNISCGEDRLVFFNVTQIEAEGKTCPDPRLNGTQVCVDYLRVDRGPGRGFTESCGNSSGDNTEQIQEGSFHALWRTNPSQQFAGFRGNVVCIDPDEVDVPGCTEVDESGEVQRKKRHIRFSSPIWKRHRNSVRRMRRTRYSSITVPFGASVLYSNKQIRFVDSRNNVTTIQDLPTLESICFLKEFDGINKPRVFIKSAKDRRTGEQIILPGGGILFYKYGFAYYQRFFVNPMGIIPSEAERAIISTIFSAIDEIFRVVNLNFTTTELPTVASPTPQGIGGKPYYPYYLEHSPQHKRQIDLGEIGLGNMFEDDLILVAIENENACNPVLRASANSILESADPERVSFLRNIQP